MRIKLVYVTADTTSCLLNIHNSPNPTVFFFFSKRTLILLECHCILPKYSFPSLPCSYGGSCFSSGQWQIEVLARARPNKRTAFHGIYFSFIFLLETYMWNIQPLPWDHEDETTHLGWWNRKLEGIWLSNDIFGQPCQLYSIYLLPDSSWEE